MELLNIVTEDLRPLIAEMEENYPEIYPLVLNAIQKEIIISGDIYDLSFKARVKIENIEKLLLQKSVILTKM